MNAVRSSIAEFQPDAIVHLAAESHVDRSIDKPAQFVATNVVGTQVLLDAGLAYWKELTGARKEAFRFIHVSTDEVYGALGETGAFTETTPYAPRSPYSASKAASDHLAHAWRHTFGLPTIVTNCSNNYGPYQFPEKLIPLMILRGLAGQPMPVYGQGRNVRDWLFVDDHAEALWLALTKGKVGEMYLIGGESERRNIDVVNTIASLLDEMAPQRAPHARFISFVEDRPGHDHRYAIDPSKIKRELGWRPQASFDQGLRADRPLVPRQQRVVGADPQQHLPARAARHGIMTARVLVIGREGQLARELARARWPDGWSVTFAGRPELDLRFPDKAAAAVAASAADLVVNAAAYTNVEQAESEPDVARLVNAAGPGAIAAACAKIGAALVSISTDYVFDGRKAGPYREDDPVNPISAYGRSKAEGEALIRAALPEHVILRTSWLFSPFGTNFVKTMMRLGSERPAASHRGGPARLPDRRRRSRRRRDRGMHRRDIKQNRLRHLPRGQQRRDDMV